MGERAAGTVTFVFTDIEGSTKKWQAHSEAMRAALARHDSILADAVEGRGGRLFKHTGDGVCAVFASYTDAIGAAVDAQRRLVGVQWDDVDGLAVRMGLHTGEADERDGDYFGTTLNRTARVMAAAHGGQIVLSGATAALVRADPPPGVDLVDLGAHVLRDLAGAERLHQVAAEGLHRDFPPPRAAEVDNNLPVPRTSFVGRAHEVSQVAALLSSARVITLVGIGGTGKTRLALEVARCAMASFPGGVFFVDLSAITDPTLIAAAVAGAIGLPTGPGVGTPLDAVLAVLATRRALVVLDNCEHLIDDCADLVDLLLTRCADVVVLATSREALDVEGERTWPVSSLAGDEARQLFLDRAAAADPRFTLRSEDEAAVSEICRRLDGIPLAIELAASRVADLGIAELAGRLDDRFRLLTGGRRRRAQRQQTLQAAIDWSHDLLDAEERALLRRLSVFAGGFTLTAADAVCAPSGGGSAVDVLRSLVAKSLVVAEAVTGTMRYRLLETLRIYAAAKLVDADEAATYRARHRDWFLRRLADTPPDELACSYDAAEEHAGDLENYRVAIDWSEAEGRDDLAARMTADLGGVWAIIGHHEEGAARLRALVERDGLGDGVRAQCMATLSYVCMTLGDFTAMVASAEDSVRCAPEGRLASLALVHAALFRVFEPASYDEAHALFDQARTAGQRHGQLRFVDLADAVEAHFHVLEGRYDDVLDAANSLPPMATFPQLNLRMATSAACLLIGDPAGALAQADLAEAAYLHRLYSDVVRAIALIELGDRDGAVDSLQEAVRGHVARPFPLEVGDLLVAFAALELHDGDAARATTLLETVFRQAGFASFRSPSTFAVWRWIRSRARDALGKPAFDAARARAAGLEPSKVLAEEAARLDRELNPVASPAPTVP